MRPSTPKYLGILVESEKILTASRQARTDLLKERRALIAKMSAVRTAYAIKSTKALEGALGDLVVSVKFVEAGLSKEGAEIIQEAMDWRTAQVPRAALIAETVTVPKLLDAIEQNDPKPLPSIESSGTRIFSQQEALGILRRLGEDPHKFKLERCMVQDRPNSPGCK
jgi:hypothetical protein